MIYKGCECMKVLKAAVVVGSALAFSLSALTPFFASADSEIITLSGFQTAQMLGVSIEAYYLGTDMQYHRRDLSLVDTSRTFVSSNLPSDHPLKELEGHAVCFYSVVNPDDLYDNSGVVTDTSQSPLWLVSWNVQLENVTHFVGGCSSIHYSRYFDYPLSSLRMYNYFTGGEYSSSVHPVDAGTTAGVANSASFTYLSGVGSIVGDSYDGTAITYYIGDSAFSAVNPHYAGNYTYFYFIAPSINSDYVLSGSSPPPDPPSDPVYTASGTASGIISENSSGGYDVDYNISIDMPDYSGLINPELDIDQSSRMGDARDTVDEYHNAEEVMLSEADDGLSSLPDLEFDETLIEDAENPFSEFFGINLVGIMVFWVGAIAFISYVLFGKWV